MSTAFIQRLLWILPAILFSLTIHEFAHGWVALRCGDTTARDSGRLTLNPFAHLDIFGVIMMAFGPFGWAKPVPVNFHNLHNPKRDMVFVALAGPASNIILAIITGLVFRFTMPLAFSGAVLTFFGTELLLITYFGIGLAFFNLIPIPPLDGSNIVIGLLPQNLVERYIQLVRYAPMVFLALIILQWSPLHVPLFSWIIDPLWKPFYSLWQIVIFGRKDFLNAFI